MCTWQGVLYFALCVVVATVLALPLAFFAVLLVVWGLYQLLMAAINGSSGLSPIIYLSAIFAPVWVMYLFLGGAEARKRKFFQYSVSRFLLMTRNAQSFHNWFIMSQAVARNLAERAAEERETDLTAIARRLNTLSAAE